MHTGEDCFEGHLRPEREAETHTGCLLGFLLTCRRSERAGQFRIQTGGVRSSVASSICSLAEACRSLCFVEDTGKWPKPLVHRRLAFIPKEDAGDRVFNDRQRSGS
ncbi:unnamed protein product [Symbiodinium sp. CCMP2592]|nr:unnamed protein product [Symbiodinium sp. CCMP2592]